MSSPTPDLFPAEIPENPSPPGSFIRTKMKEKGWVQEDLAKITNKPLPTINGILTGKKQIIPEMVITLAAALDFSPSYLLYLENIYRLSLVKKCSKATKTMAELYSLAPIKELVRRGWIQEQNDVTSLEKELCKFFGVKTLSRVNQISAFAKQTGRGEPIGSSQQAWLTQAKRLAEIVNVSTFNKNTIESDLEGLRAFATTPSSCHKISGYLANLGIRLVIVERLKGAKIDGAVFWLDQNSPVIALSLRFDRIDSFWHTLSHELRHIVHGDQFSLDSNISGDKRSAIIDEIEKRADEEGAHWLIPKEELKSFIIRKSGHFTKEAVVGFARRLKVHPGIVVGQLQHNKVLHYGNLRDCLANVKEFITVTTTCDGFGTQPVIFRD